MTTVHFLLWNFAIILESLPISSSGHIRLLLYGASQFSHKPLKSFDTSTEHLMHIPTIFVISSFLLIYGRPYLHETSINEIIRFGIASGITNFITGSAYLFKKKVHIPSLPLWLGFFISSCALLSVYSISYGTVVTIKPVYALFIGFTQALALTPGVSRLAMTCVSALWLGIDPTGSFLFSLVCELGLILVAVGVTLLSKKHFYDDLVPPTRYSYLALTTSSILSLGALIATYNALISKNIIFFGWYLLLLSGMVFLTSFWSSSPQTDL